MVVGKHSVCYGYNRESSFIKKLSVVVTIFSSEFLLTYLIPWSVFSNKEIIHWFFTSLQNMCVAFIAFRFGKQLLGLRFSLNPILF